MAARKVYKEEEVELLDGTKVKLKSLSLKRGREFTDIFDEFVEISTQKPETTGDEVNRADEKRIEREAQDKLLDMVAFCIATTNEELAGNRDKLEEALDSNTIWYVLEICAGVVLDPNRLPRAAGTPTTR